MFTYENQPENIEHIRHDYETLWTDAKPALLQGRIVVDPIPDTNSLKWGISAVIRFPPEITRTFTALLQDVSACVGEGHLVYTPTSLHTTIRSIEGYRQQVLHDDPRVQHYTSILQNIAQHYPPFEIIYTGITATPSSVLLQGWPVGNTLHSLRLAFHQALREQQVIAGPETHVRQTSHVSLMLFTHALDHPRSLIQFIEHHQHTLFGRVTIQAIELVRYHRTEQQVEVIPLTKVFLA